MPTVPSSGDTPSLALIEKLVSFDTTSCRSNLELIDFVRDYLAEYGSNSQLVFNEERTKANLYATVGPLDRPGVLLSGHTDVVPVEGQVWATDPFRVVKRDNALYGRGTADMKSFIAIVLAFVPQMIKRNLSTPIHLALSYDEEIGCVGIRRLLNLMDGLSVRPAMCIVGEPANMQVVNSHKGKLAQRVTINGLEAHSSLPTLGVNAVDIAAELIVYIRKLARQTAKDGPFDEGFDLKYTTLHTGSVHGGNALNIVPNYCQFEFEIRNIPEQDPATLVQRIVNYAKNTLEPQMKSVSASCGIDFEKLSGYPGMFTAAEADVVAFVQGLTKEDRTKKVSFGTEAGLFTERLGIPSVVCGPGSIEQAHKRNEFITLGQINSMERFMDRLILALG